MQKKNPDKEFIPAPPEAGCACNDCPYMKLNTMQKLAACMRDMTPQVQVAPEIIERALSPLNRMLALG